METIDSECDSRIPTSLLQKFMWFMWRSNLMFYRRIDVPGVLRTRMSNIYFTGSYALNTKAPEGGQELWEITNDDYEAKIRAWQ